jgi:hypothetical protein
VEKAITTIMITVASVVAMLVVVNAIFPAVSRASSSVIASGSALDDRIRTDIEIVHATGETDGVTAYIWVKNIGASNLGAIDRMDIFFGPEAGVQRVTYGGPACTVPCWEATVENAARWEPTATLLITLHFDAPLPAATTYYLKVVLPNGIYDARYFTL